MDSAFMDYAAVSIMAAIFNCCLVEKNNLFAETEHYPFLKFPVLVHKSMNLDVWF